MVDNMTLPSKPLPTIRSLLKAFINPPFTGEPWFNRNSEFLTRIYRRGSLALAAGINAVRKAQGVDSVIIWVPDYFCGESLGPLRSLPVRLQFYQIQEDLTPHWSLIEEQISREQGMQVLVLVHYFGFPNAGAEARTFCDRHGMILLEDYAHVLRPFEQRFGDLLIFSPRKFLAVPSGGVLVYPKDLEPFLEDGSKYLYHKDTFTWVWGRLSQKLLVQLHIPWHKLQLQHFAPHSLGESPAVQSSQSWSCDQYTLRLLGAVEKELNGIILRRRENYLRLKAWVDGLDDQAHPLFPILPDKIIPFQFPLMGTEKIERVISRLRSMGIPASQWPPVNLPPDVLNNQSEHEVAFRTRERLLLLHIHQSLSLNQIDMMGQQLRLAFNS
jgi:hypothetical protein